MPNVQGVEWFLKEVWPLVHKEIPNAKVHIAGRHMSSDFLNRKVPGVNFVGEVENAKNFIQKYAISVVPLLSGSGIRIKIIEGMALGKAIVTTSVGVEGINTNKTNCFVADTPEQFAQSMIELYKDESIIEKTSSDARKTAEQFYSEEILSAKLHSFIQSII